MPFFYRTRVLSDTRRLYMAAQRAKTRLHFVPVGQSASAAQPHAEIAGSDEAMHFGPNALDAQSVAA